MTDSWGFGLHFPDLDYTDNLDKCSARKWAKDMKDFSLKRIYRWQILEIILLKLFFLHEELSDIFRPSLLNQNYIEIHG